VSLLYPRLIEIRRLRTQAVQGGNPVQAGNREVGLLGYSGAEQSTSPEDINGEMVLFKNVRCDIQAQQTGRTKDGFLPTDVTVKPMWLVIVPASALPKASVRDRDIIYDDEQYRYGVAAAWWTVLGYNLSCVRMEA
jgi:hypothetical protein